MGPKKVEKRKTKRKKGISEDLDLFPELWEEILARLPLKNLLRIRSVSKSFRSIIDDPRFGLKHFKLRNQRQEKPLILIIERSPKFAHKHRCSMYFPITFNLAQKIYFSIPLNEMFCIEAYLNGLLLIRREKKLFRGAREWVLGELVLCNPSIRKSKTLPPSIFCNYPTSLVDIGFGFDDSSSYDHKIVLFKYPDKKIILGETFPVFVQILGLRENSWRTFKVETSVLGYNKYHKVSLKGAIHWLGIGGEGTHLISFHLGSASFSYMKLPDKDARGRRCWFVSVIVLWGSLAVMDYSSRETYIWTMDEGLVDSWTKCYTINLEYPTLYANLDGKLLFSQTKSSRTRWYDLKSGQMTDTVSYRSRLSHLKCTDVYVESLIWYGGDDSQLFVIQENPNIKE